MPVKPMEFTLDGNDANVTKANGTAAIMSDIFLYKVPRHTVIELRPEDIVSAYLKDAAAEAAGTDAVELVVRDPNGLTSETIFSGQYTVIKEFQDSSKTKKLGQSRLLQSDFYLALRVKATTVLVVTTCYFQITCKRWANVLG